jgi:uncharacterized membrane protein YhfC
MNLLSLFLFLIVSLGAGILAAYILLRLIGRSFNWQYVVFGMGIFFIGIAIHSLIALPVAVALHGFHLLPDFNATAQTYQIWELIYFGFAAGIGQEISKALPLWFELKRTKGENPQPPFYWLGLNIGLGFSLSEILFIGFASWTPHGGTIPLFNLAIGGFERLSATLFHLATASLIAFGIEKKKVGLFLTLSILLHALLDSFAGYTNQVTIFSTLNEEIIIFSFSLIVLLFSYLFGNRMKSIEDV